MALVALWNRCGEAAQHLRTTPHRGTRERRRGALPPMVQAMICSSGASRVVVPTSAGVPPRLLRMSLTFDPGVCRLRPAPRSF